MNTPRGSFAIALAAVLLTGMTLPAVAADALSVGPAIELQPSKDAYQRTPAVAFGDGCFLVVWQDGWNGDGGDSNIMALRVSPEGKALDRKPLSICTARGIQESPAVAWTGKEFLVVWSDLRSGKDFDIYVARVSRDGKVAKTDIPVAIKEHTQFRPRIASSGTALVVWQDLRDGKSYRIFGTRVSDSGEVLDTDGFEISAGACNSPSVAASADGFFVVWTREGPNKYMISIGGARVGRDGKIGPVPAHHFHGKPLCPVATGDGRNFFFVCSRVPMPNYWGWGGGSAFYGARVLADGTTPDLKTVQQYQWKLFPNVLDGSWLHKEDKAWPHKYSAVAFDGKQYVAVWTRAHVQNQVMLTNFDLYATRIRFPGWQKLDSPKGPIPERAWELEHPPAPGIPVAETADPEAMPAVAAGPDGILLAVYELHKPDGAIALTAKVLTAP